MAIKPKYKELKETGLVNAIFTLPANIFIDNHNVAQSPHALTSMQGCTTTACEWLLFKMANILPFFIVLMHIQPAIFALL